MGIFSISSLTYVLLTISIASALVQQEPLATDFTTQTGNVTDDAYFYGQSPPVYPCRM